ASLSDDETIGLWDARTGRQAGILEGHTHRVTCITFSSDGRLLASKAQDGSVRFWRSDTWETVAVFQKPPLYWWSPCLAFHPKAPILTTLNENDTVVQIWNIDFDTLLKATSGIRSIY